MGKIPRYAHDSLRRFLDYLDESSRLLHLSMSGVRALESVPDVFRVALGPLLAGREDSHDALMKQAVLAHEEWNSGFPLLHAHTSVGLWGAFESTVEDLIVDILVNEPDLLSGEAFSKVRIPIAEFEKLDKEERMRFLLAEIAKSIPKKNGVDKYEVLLETIGLDGEIPSEVKEDCLGDESRTERYRTSRVFCGSATGQGMSLARLQRWRQSSRHPP